MYLKERVKAGLDRQKIHRRDRNLSTLYYHITVNTESNVDIAVCLNAFRNLFGILRRPWETLKHNVAHGNYVAGPIRHGNVEKRTRHLSSNAKKAEGSIVAFLKDLSDTYAEPYATRFIRTVTSVGLRNDEEGLVELPSNYTKRKLYSDWCYSIGYKVRSDAKGSFGPTSKYEPRPFDDVLWPEGSEQLPVSSWHSFLAVWKQQFPKLKIRNSCEDVCGECVRLRNSIVHVDEKRRRRRNRFVAAASLDLDGLSSDGDSRESSSMETEESDEEYEVPPDTEYLEEYLFFKANDHVVQAQSQRSFVQVRQQQAKETRHLDHSERRFVFSVSHNCVLCYINSHCFFLYFCLVTV